MPAWSEYKKASQERGSLAFELYMVQTVPAKGPDALMENLPAHLEYQAKQEAKGALMLAGPISDETGEEMLGFGLIIYCAESLEAARAIAEADPMHSSGARTYTIRRWLVNEGGFTLNVRLSAQEVNFK